MTDADRIQALEDRVAVLEEALGITLQFPMEWGLTPQQQRMLGVLCRVAVAPKERFMAALYHDDPDPPDGNVIAVQLSRIRKKIKPLGVEIKSAWGCGWWIPAEQKARLAS